MTAGRPPPPKVLPFFFRPIVDMPDRHAAADSVTLTVTDLPPEVAAELRRVASDDPVLLRRIVTLGVTHQVVYDTLLSSAWGLQRAPS